MSKPLPKSLHTVTVLVRVAALIMSDCCVRTSADAVTEALNALGLADAPDTYALAAAAIRQLDAKGIGFNERAA